MSRYLRNGNCLANSTASRKPTIICAVTVSTTNIAVLVSVSHSSGAEVVGEHLARSCRDRRSGSLCWLALIGEERKAERPQQRKDVHHEQQRDRRRDQEAAIVAAAIGIDDGRRGRHRRMPHDNPEGGAGGSERDTRKTDDRRRPAIGDGQSASCPSTQVRRSRDELGPRQSVALVIGDACISRAPGKGKRVRQRDGARVSLSSAGSIPGSVRLPSAGSAGTSRCCRASSWRPACR